MISKYEKDACEWNHVVFRELKNGNIKSFLHFGSLHSNYRKTSWNLKSGAILLLFKVKMLVSGQRGKNNKFPKKYDPKNGLKMAKMHWYKILTQRSMGCLGQVTKVFGHFF